MIRKVVIVLLAIAAVGTGTLGVVVGSGVPGDYRLLECGPMEASGDHCLYVTLNSSRYLLVGYALVSASPARWSIEGPPNAPERI